MNELLYRISTNRFVAGCIAKNGIIIDCAPILRKSISSRKSLDSFLDYWKFNNAKIELLENDVWQNLN